MKNKPNVVLIVLDTVRADHLSCYGYNRRTSPNIERLAEEGVLFENAFSAGAWTPPSHASLFTGKYPSHHKTLGANIHLGQEEVTFAEIMSRNGYFSAAVVACPILSSQNAFDRGFQEYINVYEQMLGLDMIDVHDRMGKNQSNENNVVRLILRLLKRNPKELVRTILYGEDKLTNQTNQMAMELLRRNHNGRKPIFLFINYFNCHAPYNPPRPFRKLFLDSLEEPRLHLMELILTKILRRNIGKINDVEVDYPKIRYVANGPGGFSFAAKELEVSEKEWKIVESLYDGEIAYLDYRISELFRFLCDEGIFDDTILIITSDHGENFGEHGLASHALCLYDSVLHVPMIMTYPPAIPKKRKILSTVSTIDILPTVLGLLDIRGEYDFQGRDLRPFEEKKGENFICAEYGERHTEMRRRLRLERGLKCVRTESYKYILSSYQQEELYNIRENPLEETNIVKEYPELAKQYKKLLEGVLDISYWGPREFDHLERESEREMKKRLRALGYI